MKKKGDLMRKMNLEQFQSATLIITENVCAHKALEDIEFLIARKEFIELKFRVLNGASWCWWYCHYLIFSNGEIRKIQ